MKFSEYMRAKDLAEVRQTSGMKPKVDALQDFTIIAQDAIKDMHGATNKIPDQKMRNALNKKITIFELRLERLVGAPATIYQI